LSPSENLVRPGIRAHRERSIVGKCAATIKLLAWLVNRTPDVRNQLTNWNRTVQFSLSGERSFFVTVSDNRMKYALGEADKPDLAFASKSEDFFNVMIGRTKFDQGFSKGIYTINGSITDAVKLMRIAELTLESHSALGRLIRSTSRMLS
jgi:hypothetical protein